MQKTDFSSEYFDPKSVLECGQIFRFTPFGRGYKVFSKAEACYIYKDGAKTVIESDNPSYFYDYFDLNRDYKEIYEKALSYEIPVLSEAAAFGKGVRILRQDAEEMIYSFIISQNNMIPRIKGIISRLCEALGEEREFMGEKYYAFPSSSAMSKKEPSFFRELGAGYRDVFLSETAKRIEKEGVEHLKKLDGAQLKKQLLTYKGIGEKVANCISLFGFAKTESFPVDTWIEKVYKEDFGGKERDRKKICAYFENLFGDYSGFMQQYLFYGKRSGR